MKKNLHFAQTICTYNDDHSVIFNRTSLVLKTETNHTSIYNVINISDIPWETLWSIVENVYDPLKLNIESTIIHWIDNYDTTKTHLKLLGESRKINDSKELFTDKRKMWPLFIRDLNDQDFHGLMHETSPITQDTVNNSTNKLMLNAVDNSQYIHTVRILYRIQTEQLKILHRYNSQKNNIYFIDFKKGNKLSHHEGFESNLEWLSNNESKVNKENSEYVEIGSRNYSTNPDVVYTRRLSDLLLSLSYLKNLDKAHFWTISGTPSIRTTLVGDSEESNFNRSYFVAVREFEPGMSGRLSSNNELSNSVYRELKKTNQPREVKILEQIKELKEKLLEQIKFTELKYRDKSISLDKHKKLVEMIGGLNAGQMGNFNRQELENEANDAFRKIGLLN